MNLALYREFRPTNFDEVIGQDYIIKTLKNQILTDRLTHAYLFCGPRGTGKTSTAKIFARAVNCTHTTDGNPCNKCAECVALTEMNTDIIEIDAASNNRVEEIRDLREKVSFPPMVGKYKVYIVDEVHMLTDSAFNALLKTLEEPPKHAIFILATTEIHKLPATILSRCTRFDFKLLDTNTLVEHLRRVFDKKNIKYDEKSLYLIARAGEGSVRDMLSIADSVASFCNYDITFDKTESIIGLSDKDSIKNLLISIADKDIARVYKSFKQAIGMGKNLQVLCKEMADFIKNIILVKSGVDDYEILGILPGEFADFLSIAKRFEMDYLKRAFSKFASIELDLKYSLNPENLFISTCLEMISSPVGETVSEPEKKPTTQNNVSIPKLEQTSQPEPDLTRQNETERLWGNVLLKVKERNMFALSNALTQVNKVSRINNKMILFTGDQSCFETIDNGERLGVILKLINLFDETVSEVAVEYDKANLSDKDIRETLKNVFKDKIKFN